MKIIKNTPHISEHSLSPLTFISNYAISIINRAETLAVYWYIKSKSGDWVISEIDINKRFGLSIPVIEVCLDELEKLGLIDKHGVV